MADRVLIVEDNEALRVGIRLSLEEAGYVVQEAATGEEAVRKLETEPCHVVITDIRLGDLSGVDILKKAKEVNSEIEVILMTAYATVERRSRRCGSGRTTTSRSRSTWNTFSIGSRPHCGWAGWVGNWSFTERPSTGTPSKGKHWLPKARD